MSNEAYINVAFQTFGGMLSLMIILFLLFIRRNKSRLDHLYIRFLICNTAVLFSNAAGWIFDGYQGSLGRTLVLVTDFCMFLFSYLLIAFFNDYLTAYLTERGAGCRWIVKTVWSICLVMIVSLIVSQFTGMYYIIDEQNIYQRQELFWISQAVPMLEILLMLWMLVHNRKRLRKQEFIAFLSYLLLPIITLVIQIFNYGVVYLYLVTTLVAICIYIFIQAEQARKFSEQALELERSRTAIMLSQIQPHFLYNSLQGIKLLCDTDPAQASEALEHFSYYLRGNLDSLANTRLVPFEKELSHIRDYLYLEKMRFRKKLNIDWQLTCEDFLIPPLTVQPLIENAIRHGINKKKGGGTLTIKTERNNGEVIICIMDDGAGFEPSEAKEDGRSHIGIENTRKRLQTMCGGSLMIESAKGAGTTAKIILPRQELPV